MRLSNKKEKREDYKVVIIYYGESEVKWLRELKTNLIYNFNKFPYEFPRISLLIKGCNYSECFKNKVNLSFLVPIP